MKYIKLRKMKSLSYIFTGVILAGVFLLPACSSDDDDVNVNEVVYSVTLSSSSQIAIDAAGGQSAVNFKSAADWTASVNQSWCSVSPSSGTSSVTSLTITVDANETYDSRSATLTIKSGTATASLTITQMQKDAIVLALSEYTVDAEGSTLEFTVSANVDFDIDISADWIYQSTSSRALEDVPLSFVVDANTGDDSREATITFTSGSISQSVKVIQSGRVDSSWLSIAHTNQTYVIPSFSGSNLASGTIWWGDGDEETYKEKASHTYGSAGSRTVTIVVEGAEEVYFPDIVGVTDIDLSQF